MINTSPNTVVKKLSSARKKNINFTPLLLIVVIGLQSVVVIQLLFQGSLLLKVNNEPASRFVELADGETIKAKPISAQDLSPEVIEVFTRQLMTMLFSASGETVDLKGNVVADEGVEINGKLITETASVALLFVGGEFLPLLLNDINLTSPQILSGDVTRKLRIKYLTDPKKVGNREGEWEVKMIGTLFSYNKETKQLSSSKFNQKILLTSIDNPTNIFPASPLNSRRETLSLIEKSYFQEIFTELKDAGLELKLISPL